VSKAGPVIVADASPLIGLAKIGQLDLLRRLFGELWIPEAVERELCLGSSRPGSQVMAEAVAAGWIKSKKVSNIPGYLLAVVDRGEAEAITLAKQESGLLLIDESRGRTASVSEKVVIFGTGAVLLRAKSLGYIPDVSEPLRQLSEAGYRLSARLCQEIRRRAGE
jgi:predicted nucleic acid-binding protein